MRFNPEQGGPKPLKIENELFSNTESSEGCKCGGNCGESCKCDGDCDGNCKCKDLTIPNIAENIPETIKSSAKKVSNGYKKYATSENLLKLAIALSVGAAAYVIIKE